MGKQWVKQENKRNEVKEALDRGVLWIAENRRAAGMAAGATLAVSLAAALFLYRAYTHKAEAWDRLALAQTYAYSGQGGQAMAQIKELSEQYAGTPAAGYGILFAGDMFYRQGLYKEALERYNQVLADPRPKAVEPLALSAAALAHEAAGACPEAIASANRFLESSSDHFLAPQTHASLARCLMASGQGDQAKAALQKIALQYPDTSWAQWAQAKLEGK